MIFGPQPVAACAGAILAHSMLVAGKRWPKGRVLTAADLDQLAASGVTQITVAQPERHEIAEDIAATRLAVALTGTGVKALAPVHGRVNLVATADGLFSAPRAAIDTLNAIDEALTLGTLPDHARVASGDIIATIKIIPYAVAASALETAIAAATRLKVHAFTALGVDLFQTRLPATSEKLLARTDAVTRARVTACGGHIVTAANTDHDTAALAAMLAQPTRAAITLIAGASATVDRGDVIPAAIQAAGGSVERLGMPVDPGNLLVLGQINGRPVIGLPGCARSPKRNGFDWVLERLFAGIPVTAADIANMGSGGLLAETERPEPRARHLPPLTPIGAIVLAAGRSTRMGSFKLLEPLGGQPMVAHIVDALAQTALPPPIIVLGHEATAVRAALADRLATFVEAEDYARGLSHSLRAGLKAIPADWRGVLIALGDMPRIQPATLGQIAAAATSERSIIVPVHNGQRGNPVFFGRAWFPRLADLSGDRGGKPLLEEFADLVTEIETQDAGIFLDIDTQEALATARA